MPNREIYSITFNTTGNISNRETISFTSYNTAKKMFFWLIERDEVILVNWYDVNGGILDEWRRPGCLGESQ